MLFEVELLEENFSLLESTLNSNSCLYKPNPWYRILELVMHHFPFRVLLSRTVHLPGKDTVRCCLDFFGTHLHLIKAAS